MFTITLKKIIIFTFFLVLTYKGYSTIYYSQGSLDPANKNSWNTARSGGGGSGKPHNFTSGDTFAIQNSNSMDPATAWTVSGTGAAIQIENGGTLTVTSSNVTTQLLIILSGGIVTVASGQTLTVNNGNSSGDDLSVTGTLTNAGTITFASSTAIINNGGKYQHAQNGGTIITATWSTGSTCEITGVTSTIPSAGNTQKFYNYTWNCSSQSAAVCLCGGFTTIIAGNFTVQNTNTQQLQLANGSSNTDTIKGDLIVSTSGILSLSNGTGNPYIILKGNLTVNGTLTKNTAGTGIPIISFANTSSKIFTNSGTISNQINFVDSVGTVDFGTNILTGSGTFTMLSGATILIGSTAGITTSGSTGNIQLTGTRTYNIGANYSYTGSSSQVFGNGLPTTVNNLTISNGNTSMALNGAQTINGTLSITNGKISIGANTLTLNGDFSGSTSNTLKGNGTSSNLTISGSGTIGNLFFDQTTSGTTNRLQNLTINRSAQTITLGNTLEVSGIITPTAGTLATGGTLTLVSNSSGTARIAAGSGSYISGNVKVQRYISSVGRRWRYMGSTITNATLEDWRGEIFVTGNNSPSADQSNTVGGSLNWGFDAIQSSAATVYYYDETVITGTSNTGWTAVTNSTSSLTNISLTVGKGYRVFVRGDRSSNSRLNGIDNTQNAVTMDLNGPVNKGNITMPVTFTSSGTLANDGWCLLTNPYPSPYDWDAFWAVGNSGFNGTNYTNIDPTIYIFDATSNSYKSYNASSHSGTLTSGIIPSGSSFFVKATGSSPAITFVETYKSNSTPIGLYKTSNNTNELTIKLSYDLITSDDCILKNLSTSSKKSDINDILKLNNPDVNISSYLADSSNLSLNCIPFSEDLNDTIYLNVTGKLSSTYQMYFNGTDSFVTDKNIFLYDIFLNTITDLHNQKLYSFDIDINNTFTYGKDRFKIILSKNQLTGIENITPQNQLKFSLFPNPSIDKIAIQSNIKFTEKITFEVLDINGKKLVSSALVSSSNNENYLDISSLKSGIYFIHILSGGEHSSILKFVKE